MNLKVKLTYSQRRITQYSRAFRKLSIAQINQLVDLSAFEKKALAKLKQFLPGNNSGSFEREFGHALKDAWNSRSRLYKGAGGVNPSAEITLLPLPLPSLYGRKKRSNAIETVLSSLEGGSRAYTWVVPRNTSWHLTGDGYTANNPGISLFIRRGKEIRRPARKGFGFLRKTNRFIENHLGPEIGRLLDRKVREML